ncbi:hypothetical protein [Desnuesiella massiliensis]|uniref:hypothetical protein n=1 Tax=Desnuesiella massiliensis TaxID=1650662 RepID=UPI0012B51BA6|nr:hypothetical protein [Desnuesiella massiliensis]
MGRNSYGQEQLPPYKLQLTNFSFDLTLSAFARGEIGEVELSKALLKYTFLRRDRFEF